MLNFHPRRVNEVAGNVLLLQGFGDCFELLATSGEIRAHVRESYDPFAIDVNVPFGSCKSQYLLPVMEMEEPDQDGSWGFSC